MAGDVPIVRDIRALIANTEKCLKEAAALAKIPLSGKDSCETARKRDIEQSIRRHGSFEATTSDSAAVIGHAMHYNRKAKGLLGKGDLSNAMFFMFAASRGYGVVLGLMGGRSASRELMQSWAKLRHAETYETRDRIIEHWKKKISPTLSAQKAADEMLGLFKWPNGNEVAHRKLAQYVALAKKELRSTGKA